MLPGNAPKRLGSRLEPQPVGAGLVPGAHRGTLLGVQASFVTDSDSRLR
jgi:hypothetical protein